MELPVWFEVGSLIVLVLILIGDLLLILKRPHIPSTKESTLWVVFYVTLALIFAGLMWYFAGGEYAGQFIAGWLTEYSLSIDNLFVFVLIMNQFAVRGPMGRTVADIALLLSTMSGYSITTPSSLEDDTSLETLTPDNVHERLKADHKGKKVAWLGDWNGYLPMEPGVLPLCEEALNSFSAFGVGVEALPNPIDPNMFWNEIWLPLRHFGSVHLKAFYDNPDQRKLMKPEAIYEYEGSLKYSAQDIYAASLKRSDLYRKLLTVFETYDAIAVPTAQIFAFDKTIHWPKEIEGKKMDTYHRWMEVVTHWTMSGCPVVAIPAGFDAAGRSMGIQLIGKPRGDLDLLRLARAYEQENDWVNARRPKLLDV